jgi:hypothetical protein
MNPTDEHLVRIGRRHFVLVPWLRAYLAGRDEIIREDCVECVDQPTERYEGKLRRHGQEYAHALLASRLLVPAPADLAAPPPAVDAESAVHEAGHAIVGHLLGLQVRKVTACALPSQDRDGYEVRTPFCQAQLPDPVDPLVHATWIVAGKAATTVLLGVEERGDGFDNRALEALADRAHLAPPHLARLEGQARQRAAQLVRRHEAAVRSLADRLLERPVLSERRFQRALARAMAMSAQASEPD